MPDVAIVGCLCSLTLQSFSTFRRMYTGRLLTIETVSMPVAKTNHVINHVTRWHDNVDVDSTYAFALRVFTIIEQHHHHHINLLHHQQQQQQQLHGPLKPVIGLSSDETTSTI